MTTSHVSEATHAQATSGGIIDIMSYYDDNDIDYPNWLVIDYFELPRYCKDKDTMKYRVSTSADTGYMSIWIIENLTHKWHSNIRYEFHFESDVDAMAFKLRWG